MIAVATRKCVQHPTREAAARCPACGNNFCAECVVEHDGRVLCNRCLALEIVVVEKPKRATWQRVRDGLATTAWICMVWAIFYLVGSGLKLIPSRVHDGTVWKMAPAASFHGARK